MVWLTEAAVIAAMKAVSLVKMVENIKDMLTWRFSGDVGRGVHGFYAEHCCYLRHEIQPVILPIIMS